MRLPVDARVVLVPVGLCNRIPVVFPCSRCFPFRAAAVDVSLFCWLSSLSTPRFSFIHVRARFEFFTEQRLQRLLSPYHNSLARNMCNTTLHLRRKPKFCRNRRAVSMGGQSFFLTNSSTPVSPSACNASNKPSSNWPVPAPTVAQLSPSGF
jgi:hypothetical protein